MVTDNTGTTLSSTVLSVIDQFVATMRADDTIDGEAIGRLEALVRQEAVPKSQDIDAAFFDLPQDGET